MGRNDLRVSAHGCLIFNLKVFVFLLCKLPSCLQIVSKVGYILKAFVCFFTHVCWQQWAGQELTARGSPELPTASPGSLSEWRALRCLCAAGCNSSWPLVCLILGLQWLFQLWEPLSGFQLRLQALTFVLSQAWPG